MGPGDAAALRLRRHSGLVGLRVHRTTRPERLGAHGGRTGGTVCPRCPALPGLRLPEHQPGRRGRLWRLLQRNHLRRRRPAPPHPPADAQARLCDVRDDDDPAGRRHVFKAAGNGLPQPLRPGIQAGGRLRLSLLDPPRQAPADRRRRQRKRLPDRRHGQHHQPGPRGRHRDVAGRPGPGLSGDHGADCRRPHALRGDLRRAPHRRGARWPAHPRRDQSLRPAFARRHKPVRPVHTDRRRPAG